jgi:hypothetical protein
LPVPLLLVLAFVLGAPGALGECQAAGDPAELHAHDGSQCSINCSPRKRVMGSPFCRWRL